MVNINGYYMVNDHLVGGWPTPLKNMSQSGWWNSQWKVIKFHGSSQHQPDKVNNKLRVLNPFNDPTKKAWVIFRKWWFSHCPKPDDLNLRHRLWRPSPSQRLRHICGSCRDQLFPGFFHISPLVLAELVNSRNEIRNRCSPAAEASCNQILRLRPRVLRKTWCIAIVWRVGINMDKL